MIRTFARRKALIGAGRDPDGHEMEHTECRYHCVAEGSPDGVPSRCASTPWFILTLMIYSTFPCGTSTRVIPAGWLKIWRSVRIPARIAVRMPLRSWCYQLLGFKNVNPSPFPLRGMLDEVTAPGRER
jgi:hypothetical protein